MTAIIARKHELKQLQQLINTNEAALLAMYGRRRIGKTFLIKQFFKDKGLYFQVTGIHRASLQAQLNNFVTEYNDVFADGEFIKTPSSWFAAFDQLRRRVQAVAAKQEKVILFFDELPWLATPKSGFLQALEHCWNRYLSDIDNVIVIVCGSAASWMIKHVIHSKGGLHGRITREIRLLPFTLAETEHYLLSRGIEYDRKQIVDLYLALGGVAQYLKYVQRGRSAAQNIGDLCFATGGPLVNEFAKLYRSLFKDYTLHLKIIKALSTRSTGFSYQELADKAGYSSGGTFSNILDELKESGFIMQLQAQAPHEKTTRYRLIDEFSLFYLNWMAKHPESGHPEADQDYWLKQYHTAAWKAWSGYAFEGICLKHLSNIKQALGISSVSSVMSKWRYFPPKLATDETGVEIDMLIERADRCINLFEIKYVDKIFAIDKVYARVLANKKHVYQSQSGTKKAVFLTMISTYGVKQNAHFLASVDNQLTLDDLF